MLQNITLNPYKAQGLLTGFHLLWKHVSLFIYLLTNLFSLNSNSAHSLVDLFIFIIFIGTAMQLILWFI